MQLLVAFTQQQNFSTGRDVVPANRLRVVCDVMIVFVGKIYQVFFTGLGLCKTSTYKKLQSVSQSD
jgi:hypothetical protein